MDNDLVQRKSVMDIVRNESNQVDFDTLIHDIGYNVSQLPSIGEEDNRPQHLFIDFEPWCKDCDVFDPETIDNRSTFDDGRGNDFTVGEVIFTCKHRSGCKRLAVKETEELER